MMNLANRISITRIILIPFFIAAVVYAHMTVALVIFMVAVLTDAVDGFIARTRNQKTQLGIILDPIADKLLLTSAYICLSVVRSIPDPVRLPAYVPIIVISRDCLIIIGSLVVYMIKGDLKVSPSVVGKITTFFQMMTIICVLVKFEYSFIVWTVTIALTTISGIGYLLHGSRLLNENQNHAKRPV